MAIGHDIAMGLRVAYWSMHRQTNACLARCGVTADQFVELGLLAQQDGITQHELCRRASSDPNTIRVKLILMETHGLVARKPHPTDGRARSVTLTHRGRQVYDKLSATVKPLQNHLSALFQDREAESLVQLLGRISKAMAQLEPQRRGRSHPPQPIVKTKRLVKGEKR